MKGTAQQKLRETLRTHEEGLTLMELCKWSEVRRDTAQNALAAMPDVYIDRWIPAKKGPHKWAAVWCAVPVPEHCPRPE